VRLVIDLQSAQGDSKLRGIGRQSLALTRALILSAGKHEVFLAVSDLFPEEIPLIRHAFQDILPPECLIILQLRSSLNEGTSNSLLAQDTAEYEREKQLAALSPDVVLLSSLFEGLFDLSVTSVKKSKTPYLNAVTLHDLMPLIHPNIFLTNPPEKAWHDHKITQLTQADLLLAVSESSRQEGIKYLKLPADQVVTISSAVGSEFRPEQYSKEDLETLFLRYGLDRPFIMFTGGDSPQKNSEGLIRAYASLPQSLRKSFQLAIICKVQGGRKATLRELATSLGLDDKDLIFTGFVSDAALIAFYNNCFVFVFPSWHEGFGLPVLEAMSCGAPVLGSNLTSVPEVIALPEALFNPHDVEDIATKLQRVLMEPAFRQKLCEHGISRAKFFSWGKSAQTTWRALEKLVGAEASTSLFLTAQIKDEYSTIRQELLLPTIVTGLLYKPTGRHSFSSFLGLGWSNIEKWGIWSDEKRCTLLFNLEPHLGHELFLQLRVKSFIKWSHPWIKLNILVNGKPVMNQTLTSVNSRATLMIPLTGNERNLCHLEIRINNPCSPKSLGQSSDERELGLGLKSLCLVENSPIEFLSRALQRMLATSPFLKKKLSRYPLTETLRKDLRLLRRADKGTQNLPCEFRKGSISVVISTLNRATQLRETLESLQNQTFKDFEVIVVNGPSTDETAAVLKEWQGRIKISTCPEANLSMSRNLGITLTAGEYVAFLDDDAIPQPEWLAEILLGFTSMDVGGVGGKVLRPTGQTFQYEYASSNRLGRSSWNLLKPCPQYNYPGSYQFPYLQGTNAVFRRSALLEVGGFDEAFTYYLDETEVCLRLNDAGYLIRQLPDAWVRHKMASSDLRKNKVIQNHIPIIKSKIYFSNRHGKIYHSQREIDQENFSFIQDHRHGVQLLVNEEKLSREQVQRFEAHVCLAMEQARQALDKPARYLDLKLCHRANTPFLSYSAL